MSWDKVRVLLLPFSGFLCLRQYWLLGWFTRLILRQHIRTSLRSFEYFIIFGYFRLLFSSLRSCLSIPYLRDIQSVDLRRSPEVGHLNGTKKTNKSLNKFVSKVWNRKLKVERLKTGNYSYNSNKTLNIDFNLHFCKIRL